MIYQVSKDVNLAVGDFEGVVLHVKKRTFYYVNETGNYILKALALATERGGGVSLEALQQIVGAMFDDPEGRAAKEVEAFLIKLQDDGIIQAAEKEALLPAEAILYPLERRKYNPPLLSETREDVLPEGPFRPFVIILKIRSF